MRHAFAMMVLGCLIVSLVGCSSDPTMYSVEGKLLYKNEPAKGAMVVFHLVGDKSLNSPKPTGTVNDDGTFKLETGPKQGAPAGEYAVVVYWEQKTASAKPKFGMGGGEERTSGIDKMAKTPYASAETTPIKVKISGHATLEPFKID